MNVHHPLVAISLFGANDEEATGTPHQICRPLRIISTLIFCHSRFPESSNLQGAVGYSV